MRKYHKEFKMKSKVQMVPGEIIEDSKWSQWMKTECATRYWLKDFVKTQRIKTKIIK